MSIGLAIAVAIAGGLGAALRYTLDYTITQRMAGVFPWGTFIVNTSGSLAVGLLAGAAMRWGLPPQWAVVVGTGFLGAYTTFSTWMFETLRLVESGSYRPALTNALGSLAAGVLATTAGLALILML